MEAGLSPKLISLPRVSAPGGELLKIIGSTSEHFAGFGELYLSSLDHGIFRGWKQHKAMDSLIFVVRGVATFHFYSDDGSCTTLELEEILKSRTALQIPAGTMFGFKSKLSSGLTLANLASLEFREDEVVRPNNSDHVCGWAS